MQRGDVFESHEKDIADVLVISELDDRDLEDHLRDIDSEKECESLFFSVGPGTVRAFRL